MNDSFRTRAGTYVPADVSELARDAFASLRRNVWWLALFAVLFGALAAAYAFTRDPVYQARTLLLIDPRSSQGLGGDVTPTLFLADALIIDSEIEVLQSDLLLRRVAQRLPPPEPAPVEETGESWTDLIPWFGADTPTDVDADAPDVPSAGSVLDEQLEWIRSNLAVERVGTTFVIQLQFKAASPEIAALVANSVAEEYLAGQAGNQLDRAGQATEWLRSELARLSSEIQDAESQAQGFMFESGIPLEGATDTAAQALADVEGDIVATRKVIREAQAELQSIELDLRRLDNPDEIGSLVSVALEDARLDDLQSQLRATQARISQAEETTGTGDAPDRATGRVDVIIAQIRAELVRLRDTREARIEVASTNLASLEQEQAALREQLVRIDAARIELRAMERQIDTLQRQHEGLSTELQRSEGEGRFVTSAAEIIDPAVPPSDPVNAPSLMTVIAGAMGGLILGCSFVFLREQIDDRIRSSRDVADRLGLPYIGPIPTFPSAGLSILPARLRIGAKRLSRRRRREVGQLFGGARRGPPILGTTLRQASMLLREPSSGRARCALVTSPASGDGKTVFTANLAVFLADRGMNVLLVDGDPYTRQLSLLLGSAGVLEETGEGEADGGLTQIRQLDGHLSVLLLEGGSGLADPSEYIAALRKRLRQRAGRDDILLIDGAPLATAVEEMVEAADVDQVLLVLRFGSISASALRSLLRLRPGLVRRITGTFISRISDRSLRQFEPLTSYDY